MEIGSSYYTPYPGTIMYEKPEAYGIKVMDKEVITGAGDEHVFCRTDQLSRFDILELKQDFKNKIRKKMSKLSKKLPRELISKHFQAFHKWNLATDWYEILTSENQSRYSYFKTIFSGFAKNFEYVAEKNFEDAYPFRTAELIASKEGRYIVRTLDGSMRLLDPLENMILELSAGKLSFNKIVTLLAEQNPDVSLDKMRQACIERLEFFDKECLVVWKTNEQ
jgi:anaerobic magnesium-protoporphyrin IX monomethyl ester cyclase